MITRQVSDEPNHIPDGWVHLVGTFRELLDGHHRHGEGDDRSVSFEVKDGTLRITLDQPDEHERGLIAGARALSAEICDRCARPGAPVENEEGHRGTRCDRCRTPDQTRRPRDWPLPEGADEPDVVSPGQWTQDLRGGMTGGNWNHRDWRSYGRLEIQYREPVRELMDGENDDEAMRLWAGGAGWAGLVRALFLTLRPEQDQRPDDPGHTPWRLRWMKEKWGSLRVRTTGSSAYQRGVETMIENMSGVTCIHCGGPGVLRTPAQGWYRPECDECWSESPRGHEDD